MQGCVFSALVCPLNAFNKYSKFLHEGDQMSPIPEESLSLWCSVQKKYKKTPFVPNLKLKLF